MKSEILVDEWHKCYTQHWKGVIVPEAIGHPAKFSRSLIQRIYQHAIEEQWIQKGDRVIDPFGGVALGGLEAMRHGLTWCGIELEARFVGWGNQNIALWNERFGRLPNWGSAVLLQGDSRKLLQVLAGDTQTVPAVSSSESRPEPSGVGEHESRQISITSPPYSPHALGHKGAGNEIDKRKGLHARCNDNQYGEAEGQLSQMKEGEHDLAISSPPYGQRTVHGQAGIDWEKAKRSTLSEGGQHGAPGAGLNETYGTEEGQLARMPANEEGLDIALSSPPYSGNSGKHDRTGHERARRRAERLGLKQGLGSFKTSESYGHSDGQLGSMDEGDLALSSPPYINSVNAQDHGIDWSKVDRTNPNCGNRKRGEDSKHGQTLRSHLNYSGDEAQLGAMVPGDLDAAMAAGKLIITEDDKDWAVTPSEMACLQNADSFWEGDNPEAGDLAVSSPPYAQPHQGGGGINVEGYKNNKLRPGSEEKPFDLVGKRSYQGRGGDREDGNLETLETGDFDTAVTSPPSADQNITGRRNFLGGGGNDQPANLLRHERQDGYGETEGQLGGSGETFWSAARIILEQLHAALKPGAHAIFVTKQFVRGGRIVEFPDQWAQLCEAVGFKQIHEHRALLTEKKAVQPQAHGIAPEGETWRIVEDKDYSVSRKSFFRRLHESKNPSLKIEWESVQCFIRE